MKSNRALSISSASAAFVLHAMTLATPRGVASFVPDPSFLPRNVRRSSSSSSPIRSRPLFSERSSSDTTRPASPGDGGGDDDDGASASASSNVMRQSEFLLSLEPNVETDVRRRRLERDVTTKARFAAFGDELWDLRSTMETLSHDLIAAMSGGDTDAENSVRDELLEAERRDPELVYELELEEMARAEGEGRAEEADAHREEAMAARSCLPYLNLEGLWVGKYGGHGYEMINVTYTGDTLTAFKITGDKNVPRGEVTFRADLSPLSKKSGGGGGGLDDAAEELKPIKLTETAAKKWGTNQLPRYAGNGQVAEEGFTNNQWMDGQLIIIGDSYFSFAWLPISHQIFFGRPSPELSLKMLREAGSAAVLGVGAPPPSVDDNDFVAMKEYAARCLEVTSATLEDDRVEGKAHEFSCIWHDEATEECYFE